jgi:hypothetical protein
MPKIPPDIQLARIRQKLKAGLGRDLTAEECRLLGLSDLVIKPESEQPGDASQIPKTPKQDT